MHKWTKTFGLLFMAAASVYSDQAFGQKSARLTKSDKDQVTDVKVLEESDPFAAGPSTAPASQPSDSIAAVLPSQLQLNNDGTFSLNIVSGADLVEQLRVIGFQGQLSIIPSKEVRGALPAIDLYDVTVTEALDALLHSNGYAWRQKGNFVYVYSVKEIEEMEKANRVVGTEVFRLFYASAVDAQVMLKPILSEAGQMAISTPSVAGLESGTKDAGGNSRATEDLLVITDYPEVLDRVRTVLKEIDRRPQQILIEATILRASLNEDNSLGVDFTILGGVDFGTLSQTSNTNSALNGNIINDADSAAIVDDGYSAAGTGFTAAVPPGGLQIGFVQNNIAVFLSALESVTDTVILANPKVLALNKQKGEVIVGRKDGYLTTTVTESTATQTVEFLDTGTRLIFRPFIGDDGYIRMEIHPEDSSGGLNPDNLPFKVTTEVTSNVMIKDGHTIVIGGLFRESSDSARGQVPFLGNVPLAGWLFRQQRDRTVREEVIILLTPHIINDDSVYAQISEQEMQIAERLRVGVRKGMMPFGRERMADGWYQSAVKEMDKDNPDRKHALFCLDAATRLNPKFTEAITLKEDLSGRQITASSGSGIRSFVTKSIMVDLPPPATQPSAEVPTTQPLAAEESAPVQTDVAASDTELLSLNSAEEAIAPTDEVQSEQELITLDADEAIQPLEEPQSEMLAEVESIEPATQPVAEVHVLLPSTQPAVAVATPAPTTQPLAQTKSGFGISSLKDLFKADGEQQKTTVTELPSEEVGGGPSDD